LLPVLQQEAPAFLQSLDLFVYSLSGELRESWGRCVVEAMLSGQSDLATDATKIISLRRSADQALGSVAG